MRHGILPALALLAVATNAHAMVLCATRAGAIAAADERCRKREVQLEARDLGVIGLAGLPGPAGPAGPDGPSVERPFRIVDANGVAACTPLASDGDYIQCVLEGPDAAPVQLVLRPDGSDPAGPVVYYPTAGCQGAAFTREVVSLIPRATLLGPRLFVANGPRARLAALSAERAQVVCSSDAVRTAHGTCCVGFTAASEQMVAPTREIELSTLGLTAPLRGEKP